VTGNHPHLVIGGVINCMESHHQVCSQEFVLGGKLWGFES
jgi:hypothetical protein